MISFEMLPGFARARVRTSIRHHYGADCPIVGTDVMSPSSPMRYGYIVIEGNRVLVADCSGDRDELIDEFVIGVSRTIDVGSQAMFRAMMGGVSTKG